MHRRFGGIGSGLVLLSLSLSLSVVASGQTRLGLPQLVSLELRTGYFMTEAMELFRGHSTRDDARRYVAAHATEVQFSGLQELEGETSLGYVSRMPETFVSATLFFDTESDSLSTVHILMSPGRASRALRFIEDAYATAQTGGGQAYLLGVEGIDGRAVRVLLGQRESEIGTLYSIDYTLGE
jgi:hypothetical protein